MGETPGAESTPYTFTAPSAASLAVCAVITGGSPSPNVGGPASYVLATPLSSYINNDESAVAADSGASFTLTDYVSGGTTPYTYQWTDPSTTVPSSCTGLPSSTIDGSYTLNATQNALNPPYGSPSYTTHITGTPGTYYVEVEVTDSTSPGAHSYACEYVTINLEAAFEPMPNTGDFTIGGTSSVIIGQVGSPALVAVVMFVGGSSWYAVTIYSGTDSICANDKTVVASQNDITADEAILSFPEPSTPSSITYYCAVVSDITGNTVVLGPVQVDISPALTTPTLAISPTSIDFGMSTTVTAKVSWAGGNAPYTVQLMSGSSSSCASDTTLVATHTGIPGITTTFTFPSPSSTTFYCAGVYDSSAPPSLTNSTSVEFLVEGLFAVNAPTASSLLTEVQNPVYEGVPDTVTVTWSGGSGPFTVTLYQYFSSSNTPTSDSCGTGAWMLAAVSPGSNPVTGIAASSGTESASFSVLLEPSSTGSYYYCAAVTDLSVPVTLYTPTSKAVVVAAYLGSVTLTTPSPPNVPGFTPGTDTGQSESFYLVVTWSGGSAPYSVTLTSGSTAATCGSTTVATQSGIATTSTKFQLTSPTSTTYYCATVTDSSVPQSMNMGGPFLWSTAPPPSIAFPITQQTMIEAGMAPGVTLIPTIVSPGTNPDFVQYFIGAGCASGSAITGLLPNPVTGFTGVAGSPVPVGAEYNTGILTATTTYSVLLTDSSTGTPALSSCANITISVIQGPQSVAAISTGAFAGLVYVTNTSPGVPPVSVIDTDSNSVVATIPDALFTSAPGGLPSTAIAYGIALNPGESFGYGWVTFTDSATGLGWVCLFYLATNTVWGCFLSGGLGAEGIAFDYGLGLAYIANSGSNTVSVFNYGPSMVGSPVAVGPGPSSVAVDQNTHTVFVTDSGGNTVSVLQPRLGGGYAVTNVMVGFEPAGVAVDPATDNVWVANYGSGTISVLNGFNYNVIQTIKVGGNPTAIAISDANNEALVTNAATNTVTPISLTTFAPGTSIAVGSQPSDVADFLSGVSGIPSLAFVTNSGSNTVNTINLATGQVTCTIVVP